MKSILIFFFSVFLFQASAQDSSYLKAHFLYGSKPLKKFKKTESKWFGGILGGHVGIEVDSGRILSFVPKGKFHWFSNNKNMHSTYIVHTAPSFYSIFGGSLDSVKKTIVYVPITSGQKHTYDSIASVYLNETPYDYAFFGMRCAAAAHDILGHLKIVHKYSIGTTYKKIFYPRKLRKKIFAMARKNHWKIIRSEGSVKRKWDKD